MTLTDLDTQLRSISDELRAIDERAPEMTGIDLAFERGNITQDEWQAASDASSACAKRAEEQVQRIEQLGHEHAAVMTEYLGQLLDRLAHLHRAIDALAASAPDGKLDRTLRFNRTLIPDLIACLTAWRDRTPTTASLPWAWRIVFRVADETATALDKNRTSTP